MNNSRLSATVFSALLLLSSPLLFGVHCADVILGDDSPVFLGDGDKVTFRCPHQDASTFALKINGQGQTETCSIVEEGSHGPSFFECTQSVGENCQSLPYDSLGFHDGLGYFPATDPFTCQSSPAAQVFCECFPKISQDVAQRQE